MRNIIIRISLALTLLLLVAAVMTGCGGTEDAVDTWYADDTTAKVNVDDGYKYEFDLNVVFADGTTKSCKVPTNFETVGEALLDAGLIDGEQTQYGLTVYTVCGVTVDFNKDSAYWALYVDGEYAMSGVDSIKCADVKEVEFRVEKLS